MFLVVGLLVARQTSFEMRHGSYRLRRMVTRRWLRVTQDIVRFRGNLLFCPQDLLLMNVAVTQHLSSKFPWAQVQKQNLFRPGTPFLFLLKGSTTSTPFL
jgi:hypothetical protein